MSQGDWVWFGEYVKLGLLERKVNVDEAGLFKRTVVMMKKKKKKR